jgi:hypothetical protein
MLYLKARRYIKAFELGLFRKLQQNCQTFQTSVTTPTSVTVHQGRRKRVECSEKFRLGVTRTSGVVCFLDTVKYIEKSITQG